MCASEGVDLVFFDAIRISRQVHCVCVCLCTCVRVCVRVCVCVPCACVGVRRVYVCRLYDFSLVGAETQLGRAGSQAAEPGLTVHTQGYTSHVTHLGVKVALDFS